MIKEEEFLDDLRVGDIIYELEALKKDKLTETESSGAVLLFLAENFDEEHLIEALKFDDIEFLKEILSKEILRLEKYDNNLVKARYKISEDVVEDIVKLIHKIGSYEVRMVMNLVDDIDISDFEEEQKKRVDTFIRVLSTLKKASLTESEKLGIYLLILYKMNGFHNLKNVLASEEKENLVTILKEEIDSIRKDKTYSRKYKNSKNIVEETLDLVYNKIGLVKFREAILEHIIDIEVDEEILFG